MSLEERKRDGEEEAHRETEKGNLEQMPADEAMKRMMVMIIVGTVTAMAMALMQEEQRRVRAAAGGGGAATGMEELQQEGP